MTIEQMREWILLPYPTSRTWKIRVSRMPDDQVRAIYLNFEAEGRFTPEALRKYEERKRAYECCEHQLTFYEVFGKELLNGEG